MTGCQFRWVVQDVLRLSRGRFAEIPDADRLIGSLAHALAERAFPPGPIAPDADIRKRIEAAFEPLVLEIAAPLLQPENAGELAAARDKAPTALRYLADFLRQKGIEVVGPEQIREAEFGAGFEVTGRIDLKWSRSARRRRKELEEGRALQLATYGAIAQQGVSVPGAFYLLRQRRLIGPAGAFIAVEGVDAPCDLAQTWSDLFADWRLWRKLAEHGTALALGLPEAAVRVPAGLAIAPSEDPCRNCELTVLCRIGEEALR
jgi:ATP-dependent helicase/nuclease subunit B